MAREIDLTSFLNGSNAVFLEQLYASYIEDPQSVDTSWRNFFDSLGDEAQYVLKQAVGASWSPKPSLMETPVIQEVQKQGQVVRTLTVSAPMAPSQDISAQLQDTARIAKLIRTYRARGHLAAKIDPLGLLQPTDSADLDLKTYGFSAQDMDRTFYVGGDLGFQTATLRQVFDRLTSVYCGSLGLEYMHMHNTEQRDWLMNRFESTSPKYTKEGKGAIVSSLIQAEDFEKFLSVKFPGAKRFGLEGGESMIPCLDRIIRDEVKAGVQDVIIGMAHRGRLNVLGNIVGMGYEKILSEFQPHEDTHMQGSGDVKYHLGASCDRTIDGRKVHISLTSNPSHLEAVNPVVAGKVRAKQTRLHDDARQKVLGILIHGDAAFAGQGLVAETLMLSELRGYKTGGTIHVIINNQIGFTTSPHMSRSSPYCSDGAKVIQAPIIHVNGDDPEAVVYAAEVASQFHQKFKKDIVIDLYCYRRHGHNEIDEPAFTQPLMYEEIRKHPSTRTLYVQKLVSEGSMTQKDLDAMDATFQKQLQDAFEKAKSQKVKNEDWLEGVWSGIKPNMDLHTQVVTGIADKTFDQIAKSLTSFPQGFDVHKRLQRVLDEKAKNLQNGTHMDWATGEALAFGSLLTEGYPVRLSGQDVGRGTFSQRHAIIYDQTKGTPYVPLNHIQKEQAVAEIIDSPLSEAAVLGFDLGYSLADPDALVLWEAQFGDFANGAQVIIDQFISSGEAKWLRMSGLVMLLPHAYEGQGPEHSSARFERYLQLCAEDNMQVCNITTPANYFHALRRQIARKTRKPLIIMTPKSLLRHKLAVSDKKDFTGQTTFKPFISDATVTKPQDIKRVVFCTGKVYYDLYEAREAGKLKDVALMRLEQIYPFPHKEVVETLKNFKGAQIIWCQEEPKNMGAWFLVDDFLEKAMIECKRTDRPQYVGRAASAATATGSAARHESEQKALVNEALNLKK